MRGVENIDKNALGVLYGAFLNIAPGTLRRWAWCKVDFFTVIPGTAVSSPNVVTVLTSPFICIGLKEYARTPCTTTPCTICYDIWLIWKNTAFILGFFIIANCIKIFIYTPFGLPTSLKLHTWLVLFSVIHDSDSLSLCKASPITPYQSTNQPERLKFILPAWDVVKTVGVLFTNPRSNFSIIQALYSDSVTQEGWWWIFAPLSRKKQHLFNLRPGNNAMSAGICNRPPPPSNSVCLGGHCSQDTRGQVDGQAWEVKKYLTGILS